MPYTATHFHATSLTLLSLPSQLSKQLTGQFCKQPYSPHSTLHILHGNQPHFSQPPGRPKRIQCTDRQNFPSSPPNPFPLPHSSQSHVASGLAAVFLPFLTRVFLLPLHSATSNYHNATTCNQDQHLSCQ